MSLLSLMQYFDTEYEYISIYREGVLIYNGEMCYLKEKAIAHSKVLKLSCGYYYSRFSKNVVCLIAHIS